MNPYQKIHPRPQAYRWLRFGEIRPAGWLRARMLHDLEHGFVGHLDELVPDLIRRDDIYGADRLTKAARTKDLGVVSQLEEAQAQFLWWNSETQSNWRDGFVRSALLLDHPDFLPKVRAYVARMLATQDPDGYLGIYAPDLRFNFKGENGELWAQATLLRVLLGYHEATGEAGVLAAVRRAVGVTLRAYPPGQAHPFDVRDDYAGVWHGLAFCDVLDRLHQLTGEARYADDALWLYAEYSRSTLAADDVSVAHLLDPGCRFRGHGVHTYEHLRALLTAVYASGNPVLQEALDAYLARLEPCLAPSGAPIGDENIDGRAADASETGYEYCSIHELLDSYSQLLQKTGEARWADRIEWLLFNAGEGARHPTASAIAYLKTDNSFSMTGRLHPNDPDDARNPQTRYKYSPAHQDVAVCCVPNAGRILPYYVKAMWLRQAGGLVAALYGASELRTGFAGAAVRIAETTGYPFDLEVRFDVDVSRPVEFELAFRLPAWAGGFTFQGVDGWRAEPGWIRVRRTWQGGERIVLRFEAEVKVNPFREEGFVSRGPLVYALPLAGVEAVGRAYPAAGFRDRYYAPGTDAGTRLELLPGGKFSLAGTSPEGGRAWGDGLALAGEMADPATGRRVAVRLVPMGGSVLRRVTFRRAGN